MYICAEFKTDYFEEALANGAGFFTTWPEFAYQSLQVITLN